jgi:hypothetical protein
VSADDLIECDLFHSSLSFVPRVSSSIFGHMTKSLVPRFHNNGEDYLKLQIVRGGPVSAGSDRQSKPVAARSLSFVVPATRGSQESHFQVHVFMVPLMS